MASPPKQVGAAVKGGYCADTDAGRFFLESCSYIPHDSNLPW